MAGSAPGLAQYPITRRGSRLIIPIPFPVQAATLPPLCVRCGGPANGKPVEKTYYWHHPALYLVILAGVLVYAIVAIVVRKSMKVRVSLCAQHAQKRSTAITLAWVLPLIGLVDAFVLPRFNVDGGIVALVTITFMMAGLIIWVIVNTPIRPKFIDQTRGEFTGFCETFLQQFPEFVQQIPMVAAPASSALPPPPPI